MLFRDFNVTLIEKMGENGMKEAWTVSKPTFKYNTPEELQADLQKVIDNDLPLAGFNLFCFKIGSSLLFRDLIFSLRPIQAWATSSRIVKIRNFGLESNTTSEETIDAYYNTVKAQDSGTSLDLSKRLAPLQQYTEFCVVLDLRTLVVFAKTIRECDESLYESHVVPMLKAANVTLDNTKSKSIYNKLSLSEASIEKIDEKGGVYYDELTESYELGVNVSFALGAQFLRQHFARVRSSIWNELKENGYQKLLDTKTSSSKFYYLSTAEIEQWKQVCSRRTCFVAQFDWSDEFGWDYIIGKWIKNLDYQKFANNLPCKGCGANCNIFNETSLRLYSKRPDRNNFTNNSPDENPPCPLLIEDPSMIKLRKEMYKSDSDIFNKWEELCSHLKDNPENEARLFYENKSNIIPKDTNYLIR